MKKKHSFYSTAFKFYTLKENVNFGLLLDSSVSHPESQPNMVTIIKKRYPNREIDSVISIEGIFDSISIQFIDHLCSDRFPRSMFGLLFSTIN